jgi:CubicO group peptidase (beta-lactamase class C family)
MEVHALKALQAPLRHRYDQFRCLQSMALVEPVGERMEVILEVNAREKAARLLRDLRPKTPFPGKERPAQTLAERMMQCATPGVSIAAIDGFDVAWSYSFGKLAVGTIEEVTSGTPFQAGSVSKPVFALAVMKLIEAGTLDLDADVNNYLKSWRVPENDGWQPRVTLRQLLSHTAGTTVHGFPGYPPEGPFPALSQILQGVPPSNTAPILVDILPGTQFRYSGGGTTIAQQAVVDATGMPFADLMRELILDPTGMKDSTFEQPLPPEKAARAAKGHPWNGLPTQGGWHVYPEMAAAGLWTTASDLACLGSQIMQTFRGGKPALGLKHETVMEMIRPQLPDQKAGQDFSGLGWTCSGADEELRMSHGGWDEGFVAQLTLFPALGKGAAVMINSNQGWPLLDEVISAIGREFDFPTSQRASLAKAMLPGADCSGLYTNQDGVASEVTQSPEGLALKFQQQAPIPLVPASNDEFFATVLNLRVNFQRSDTGLPTSMTVESGGKTINLTRKNE